MPAAVMSHKEWIQALRRIWGMAGKLEAATGVDKDTLVHDYVRERFAVDSLKELTLRQVVQLTSWLASQLAALPDDSPGRPAPPAGDDGQAEAKPRKRDSRIATDEYCADAEPRPGAHHVATAEQLRMLELLRDGLGWNKRRYMGFCRRQIGLNWPQTKRQVISVHEGMERYLMRNWTPKRQRDRHVALRAIRDRLTAWEQRFLDDTQGRVDAGKSLHFASVAKLAEIDRKRSGETDAR